MNEYRIEQEKETKRRKVFYGNRLLDTADNMLIARHIIWCHKRGIDWTKGTKASLESTE